MQGQCQCLIVNVSGELTFSDLDPCIELLTVHSRLALYCKEFHLYSSNLQDRKLPDASPLKMALHLLLTVLGSTTREHWQKNSQIKTWSSRRDGITRREASDSTALGPFCMAPFKSGLKGVRLTMQYLRLGPRQRLPFQTPRGWRL